MNRRGFIGSALLTALGLTVDRRVKAADRNDPDADEALDISQDGIDPYYLEPADLSPPEQEKVQAFLKYQEDVLDGRPAILPRGGKPKRAPSYRLLHWQGQLGDPRGRLVGCLGISPTLAGSGPFRFNGQILGFNVCTHDFGRKGNGALTVELRARYQGEPMTWFYMEQFEATEGGGNSLGLGYVAQRDGMPEAVTCEEPRVDIRIQLIKQKGGPGILGKVLKVGSFLTGLPIGGGGSDSPSVLGQSPPVLRVPQMLREGVAFAQGTIASTAEDAPLWRSGFMSLALARGAGRMAVQPGLWVAIDDSQEIDYSKMKLDDIGGRIGVRLDGEPVDLNYLVLDLEIDSNADARGRGEVKEKGKGRG